MKADQIKILGDKVLVKPLKQNTVKVEQMRPKQLPKPTNLDAIPEVDPEKDLEKVIIDVPTDVQKAVVLSIPENTPNCPVNAGDTVFYHIRAGVPFDFVKDSLLLKFYDIIGVVK